MTALTRRLHPEEDTTLTDEHTPDPKVTPFGVVKLVLVLFIGLGALFTVLAIFGLFAWLALWTLLFKLATAAGVVAAAVLIISWLMQSKN